MGKHNGLLYIFDKDENLTAILDNQASKSNIFFNDEFKKILGGEWSYKFDVDMSKLGDITLEYNKVGFFDRRGDFQLFIIQNIEDNISNTAIRTPYALHDFQSLNENIIEEGAINGNAEQALAVALKGTNYSIGTVDLTENQIKDFTMMTSLEAIYSIAETYELEVYWRLELDSDGSKISNRYVDLIKRVGKDTNLAFDFSLNLASIKRKIDNNFFTVLYGRGKQLQNGSYANFSESVWVKGENPTDKPSGQIWVEDSDAVKKYGVRKGIYSNESVSIPDVLLERTWKKLQTINKPKVNYEASVIELSSIAGYENLEINLGDSFYIKDDKYNINENIRVFSETESILDLLNKTVELGEPLTAFTDEDTSEEDDYTEDEEIDFPNTLPEVPVVTATGYFATIAINWTFDNKAYYDYQLYGSDVKSFTPTQENLLFEGKASSFVHEVKPLERWYYKVRAKNSQNNYTDFSNEVYAETSKITDGANYFEAAAIKDALIGALKADRIWVNKFKGTDIDARNLTVADGNGDITLSISDIGELIGRFKELSIQGKTIGDIVSDEVNNTVTNVDIMYYLSTSLTEVTGGTWMSTAPAWESGKYMWSKTVTTYKNGTKVESDPTCIAGAKGEDGTSVNIKGSFTSTDELTSITNPQAGDGYLINGDLWVYNGSDFNNVGQIKGDKGDSGVSVTSISERYGISDSKDVEPTTWYSSFPTWEKGKYIWTKTRIAYSDGSVEYTTPYVDTSWEQIMSEVDNKVNNTQEDVFNTLTNGGEDQGIYLLDGKVYINLEYLKANSLVASKILFDDLTGKTIKGARFFTAPNSALTDGYAFRIYSDGRVYSSNLVQVYGEADDGVYSQMTPGKVSATNYMQAPALITDNNALYLGIQGYEPPNDNTTRMVKLVRDTDNAYTYLLPCYNPTSSSGGIRLGAQNGLWNIVYAKNGVSSSSDRELKENIKYLNAANARAINSEDITEDDLYNFVRDDLIVAEFNFKGEADKNIGFIAQDLLYNLDGSDNKIGQLIVNKSDGEQAPLTYNEKTYVNILAGALRKAIHKIEELEKKLNC